VSSLPWCTIAATRFPASAGAGHCPHRRPTRSAPGSKLAAACDLRVASERSVFGMPEVRVGISVGSSRRRWLPQLIGYGPRPPAAADRP